CARETLYAMDYW
nr:immunoglobulin heavy chain junction region [Mus musculus]